ncbi:hypothetical protein [Asticcacaulis solisilvae]|uniref:hypothetical protein n=1 Tax=Asticcacaulis solisilvae TaxID=1217274 RepID=UPI003FD7E136
MLTYLAIALLAATPHVSDTATFSKALADATKEIGTANEAQKASTAAFGSGDKEKGCATGQVAYDHYTAARVVFEKTLDHYQHKVANSEEIQGWLKEDLEHTKHMRLPSELFLTTYCGGIKTPELSPAPN